MKLKTVTVLIGYSLNRCVWLIQLQIACHVSENQHLNCTQSNSKQPRNDTNMWNTIYLNLSLHYTESSWQMVPGGKGVTKWWCASFLQLDLSPKIPHRPATKEFTTASITGVFVLAWWCCGICGLKLTYIILGHINN